MTLKVNTGAIGKAGQEIKGHGSGFEQLAGQVGATSEVASALGDLPGADSLANAVLQFEKQAGHQLDAAAWLLGEVTDTLSANQRQFEDTEAENKRIASVDV